MLFADHRPRLLNGSRDPENKSKQPGLPSVSCSHKMASLLSGHVIETRDESQTTTVAVHNSWDLIAELLN